MEPEQLETQYQESIEMEQRLEVIEEEIRTLTQLILQLKTFSFKKEEELLLPLGSGVFIKTYASENKVLVSVGAGIFIEKTAEDAASFYEQRVLKLNELKQQTIMSLISRSGELESLLKGINRS